MPFRLRENLSFCFAGDTAVFLDIEADRYFCVPDETAAALRSLAEGQALAHGEVAALQTLLSRGLLIHHEDDTISSVWPATLSQPDSEIQDSTGKGIPILATAYAGLATRRMVSRLKREPLRAILLQLRARKPFPNEVPLARAEVFLQRTASAFAHSQLFVASEDRCLARSLAIVSVCYERGVVPSLAVGVRTSPFTAHCWAQIGTRVLNDSAEHASQFTPVLVL